MPYAQSELSDLKAALNPLARTMAASLGGARTDQVIALLNSHLRVDISTTLRPLTDAVQKHENSEAIQAAENFWTQFPEPQTPPAGAPNIPPPAPASTLAEQSTLQHATQHNNTTIYLAYITTFGFFFLVACLIGFDRFPSIFATIKGSTAAAAEGATGGGAGTQVVQPYRDILMTLMGVIGTAWAGIISFYFGSSVGSRQQSETLQNISRDATSR